VNWRQRRQRKRLDRGRERVYPVHGYATMTGAPFTMFRCQNGHTTVGGPYALPERQCLLCRIRPDLRGSPEETVWVPTTGSGATAYLRELGETDAFIERTRTPGR
jgi:hypothetical protein